MHHVTVWRNKTKLKIINAFGGKCGICGYSKCSSGLELHHLDPSKKDFSFGSVRANPKKWALIVEELRKCAMLCCLCHREFHAGLIKIPENIQKFDESMATTEIFDDSLRDECPVCGKLKLMWNISCSVNCASELSGRYDWKKYDLRDLLINQKKSLTDVAKMIGCSPAAISRRLKKENIDVVFRLKIEWPSDDELERKIKTQSLASIARELNCGLTSLRKRIKKLGINYKDIGFFFNKVQK